jgi:hypothetical protein
MVLSMKVCLLIISEKDMVLIFSKMEINMRVNGKMIRKKVQVFL